MKHVCDLPVDFGGVSIGKETARLSIRIGRGAIDLLTADEIFCGHRLTGKVVLGRKDDNPNQTALVDDLNDEVQGNFDCKRIGINSDQISAGLTFSLADVDIASLAKFSKGTGRLVVDEVTLIPEDAPRHDDDGGDEELADTLRGAGPWRDVPLDTLFDHSSQIGKCLKRAGLLTVGNLHDYTASDKRLVDIEGIGPGKAGNIEERLMEFWEAYDAEAEEAADAEPEPAGAV